MLYGGNKSKGKWRFKWNQGIASTITRKLAKEILNRGKVPFYCSAWSNIRSVRNAIKSGFIPAWVEMTVKPTSIVDDMNKWFLQISNTQFCTVKTKDINH